MKTRESPDASGRRSALRNAGSRQHLGPLAIMPNRPGRQTTLGLLGLVLALGPLSAAAQTFSTLHSFTGGNDGAFPRADLVLSGNTLYGTANSGGSAGTGTVFKVNTDGTGFTTLYSFTGTNDGANPVAGLVLSGNTLYGTTSSGGSAGTGTVFKVNTDGTGFLTLYSFSGGNDGASPEAGLVLSGNTLFGTAFGGGSAGNGTVFKVNTDGTGFLTLYSFTGGNDGAFPAAGLVLSGNTLYGTTSSGGSADLGTVFALALARATSPTITWPSPAPITYGTALGPGQLNATASTAGTFSYSPPAGTVLNAGTGVLSVVFSPSDTVDWASATGTVSIAVLQAPLAATADNATRLYGAANPAFTGAIVGLVNGDQIGISFSTAAGAGSDVGTYPIVPALVDPNNRLGNYAASLTNGTLTITPAPLVVTANNATRPYGQTNPSFTGTITGLVNGDNIMATYACSATASSPPGSYPIVPQLVDQSGRLGNYSVTTSNGALTVLGTGTVTASVSPARAGTVAGGGDYTNGSSVVLTASTNAGYQFVAWTENGQVVSSSPSYGFSVNGDCSLVANFAPSPFVPPEGTYGGLFSDETNGVSPQSCGFFTFTTTAKNSYSGGLQLGGTKYTLSGQFDGSGRASRTITRHGLPPLTLVLRLDLLSDAEWVSGTVGDGTWTAELYGGRAPFSAKTNVAPQAGSYTLVIPGTYGSTNEPAGDSCGTVMVNTVGAVSLQLALADGTKLSPSASLLNSGLWPLYASLYSGQGVLFGWLAFTNASDLGGSVAWIKPVAKSGYYKAGFSLTAPALGVPYIPPGHGTNVLGLTFTTNLALTLTGGGLTEGITNQIALAANDRATTVSGPRLSLSFTPSTGAFNGSVVNPATSKAVSFNGVVLQDELGGSGFFIGTSGSGEVRLGP